MAEKRQKTAVILLRFPSKNGLEQSVKFELFPSEQWRGGQCGLFRVRWDGEWLASMAGAKNFFPLSRVTELLTNALVGVLGGPARTRKPHIPAGSRVSVPLHDPDSVCRHTCGYTLSPVHEGPGGQYMVWVSTHDGPQEVPASDVTMIRPKRPIPATPQEEACPL